jgi:hypothetical protein
MGYDLNYDFRFTLANSVHMASGDSPDVLYQSESNIIARGDLVQAESKNELSEPR